MKKQLLFSLAALVLSASAFAQENDDMYFNSKDRAKLKSQTASAESSYMASAKKSKKVEQAAAEEVINPTDSYSARNVNPEFAARSNSQIAAADNQDYYVNDYKTSSNLNNWSRNYSNYAGSPSYAPSYYGSSINGWGSPYSYGGYNGGYGYGYDAWGSPYYSPGYASPFSSYLGSSWGYGSGIGMGIGMSYGFGNPYYGYGGGYMNPYMSSWGYPAYAGYGYGYGGGYGYSPTVVIVNHGGDNGRNVVYGKRGSHGGMVTRPEDASYTRTRSNYTVTTRPTDAGGRVATTPTTSTRQEDYYNRSWRGSQQSSSYQQSQHNRSSSYDPWSGNSNRGTDSYNSNSYSSPSRSSYDGGGGGTRQAAPASSGSNGRSRGRD